MDRPSSSGRCGAGSWAQSQPRAIWLRPEVQWNFFKEHRMKIIATIAFVAVASAASADVEFCLNIGEAASSIMDARQHGISISVPMGLVPQDADVTEVLQEIIGIAYDMPIRDGIIAKATASREFGEAIESACLLAIGVDG